VVITAGASSKAAQSAEGGLRRNDRRPGRRLHRCRARPRTGSDGPRI